jgi:DNA polymerase-4
MWILHLDMDAFFASVEQIDDPRLKGTCVIVGGRSDRSVVSTASYEARKFGVHSAMPVYQARRLCPQAAFIAPRMDRYRELSGRIMAVLRDFSPLVQPVSIDEAYVDITGCQRLFGPPQAIGRRIKEAIFKQVSLTASVGIAPNKFLAKIASDMNKPDGLTLIAPEAVDGFVASLPVEKVPGVGKVMAESLHRLGVRCLGDVRRLPERILTNRLGNFGKHLSRLACGIDLSPVTASRRHKSVSAEQTLAADTSDRFQLKALLLQQAQEVGRELRNIGMRAKTVTLKIKFSDFFQITRRVTLAHPCHSGETLFQQAAALLAKEALVKPVRLIGLGAANLVLNETPIQQSLFASAEPETDSWEDVDRALDAIARKFGNHAVHRATLGSSANGRGLSHGQ